MPRQLPDGADLLRDVCRTDLQQVADDARDHIRMVDTQQGREFAYAGAFGFICEAVRHSDIAEVCYVVAGIEQALLTPVSRERDNQWL